MSRAIIPIADLKRRPPELGRIRTGTSRPGKKAGDKIPMASATFRFTSSDRTALEQIADEYGGEVKPWADDKAAEGQYEVITTANEIKVALPADPLGGTPQYEKYGGGGRERWCDGITCETWVNGPEGPEPTDVPCYCTAEGELDCKPTVHLSVLLLGVRGIGTWRLTTHSWNAAQEMPGMVELVQSLQAHGIQRATLRLEHKRSVQAGNTRKFLVPVLGVDGSVEELAAGRAAIGTLQPAGPVGEIGAGEGHNGSGGTPTPEIPAVTPPAPHEHVEAELVDGVPVKTRFHTLVGELTSGDDEARALRHAVIWKATDGATTNSQQADTDALEAAVELLTQVREGTWRVEGERLVACSDWADAHRGETGNGYPSGWSDLAGPDKTRALRAARALASERGEDQPASFDEIGPDLASLVGAS